MNFPELHAPTRRIKLRVVPTDFTMKALLLFKQISFLVHTTGVCLLFLYLIEPFIQLSWLPQIDSGSSLRLSNWNFIWGKLSFNFFLLTSFYLQHQALDTSSMAVRYPQSLFY